MQPSAPPPAGDPTPPTEPALDQVVDDETPRHEAVAWAVDELYADRSFDEVAAALVEGGWGEAAADEIVEAARQQTRDYRGVFTRDRVAGHANAYYRRATGRWFIGMPMLAAAWRLLHSVATLAALRRAEGEGRGKGRAR